ncbi:hypothetical protein PVAND_015079 [Polypedilum vanderplanki]|uniref:Uncharacterized protein n=1 Tax=Polypedilum vanderplanki TaxID=319348 RepID=A0A9J6BBZ2_POLVA|nr:hypothetical protein PVAND_015079 [Polypedilum vanderplanki]
MFKKILNLIFVAFCIFLAKSTVESQTTTTLAPPAAGNLTDLTTQLLTTVKNFNPANDKKQLFQQLRNQTWNSVQLMKKNNVKLAADDINKTADALKNQLANDSSNTVLKGEDLNGFIKMLREKLTKFLGSN